MLFRAFPFPFVLLASFPALASTAPDPVAAVTAERDATSADLGHGGFLDDPHLRMGIGCLYCWAPAALSVVAGQAYWRSMNGEATQPIPVGSSCTAGMIGCGLTVVGLLGLCPGAPLSASLIALGNGFGGEDLGPSLMAGLALGALGWGVFVFSPMFPSPLSDAAVIAALVTVSAAAPLLVYVHALAPKRE